MKIHPIFVQHCCACVLAFLLCGHAVDAEEIYVSLQGNDASLGNKQSPFRTIERAQQEARLKLKAGLQEPLSVYIYGGFYELTQPIEFDSRDSGTQEFPVTYAGYSREKVVLSGGRTIKKWERFGHKRGWWKAVLPEVKDGAWFFRQLTVGGHRAVRSRWPNADGELRITNESDGAKRFKFNLELPSEIPVDQGTELVVYQNWAVSRSLVGSVENQELTTLSPSGYLGHSYLTASAGKPAYLEHAYSLIDEPREWFLHRESGTLIYYPKSNEVPDKTVVVAPLLEQLLKLNGTKDNPVKHLHFKDISFSNTNFPLPESGYAEIQAAHYGVKKSDQQVFVQPVAIECIYAQNCLFDRCSFTHLGASGVGFGLGCLENKMQSCTVYDVGGNGVMIGWGGTGKKDGSLGADWADPNDAPRGNEVLSCDISRCGVDSKGGVGIWAAFSADTRIAHNVVHDMPYTGISIGFRWNSTPSSQVRCAVEYNHIYDIMKRLADGGGIYTLGFQPETIFRGNHIHQVNRSAFAHGGAPNNGFFLDEGSKGFMFKDNVIYDVSGEPVRFNQSKLDAHVWHENFFSKNEPTDRDARKVIQLSAPEIRNSNLLPKPPRLENRH